VAEQRLELLVYSLNAEETESVLSTLQDPRPRGFWVLNGVSVKRQVGLIAIVVAV